MEGEHTIADKLDALDTFGRELVSGAAVHGEVITHSLDVCAFDRWRRQANDLLYELGGCEDIHYQRFSKGVTKPHVKHLVEGLRILAEVRDYVEH